MWLPLERRMLRWSERDSANKENSTSLPQPVSIPPTEGFGGNDGLWAMFAMQLGRPPQDISFLPSTVSSEAWAINANTGCPNGMPLPPAAGGNPGCSDSRGGLFNSNESTTWVSNSIYTLGVEGVLGLDTTATFGYDDITIGTAGSGGPTIPHQVVAEVGDPRYWVGSLGLYPAPTNFSSFDAPQPSILQTLKTNNQIASLSYGYTAGAFYRNDYTLGSLTLGGYDTNLVIPNNVSITQHGDPPGDIVASIQSIKTNISTEPLLPSGPIFSFVDATIPYIYLPIDACQTFENVFGLTWNPNWSLYLVNDTQHEFLLKENPTIVFTIAAQQSGGNTVDISLPYAAFDLNISFPFVNDTAPPYLNTSRYFPLRQADDRIKYTLGRTFLQEAYLVTDYEHNNFSLSQRNWTQNTQSNPQTIYPAGYLFPKLARHSALSKRAIAGIVVGIVVGIVALSTLVVFVRRYHRLKKQAQAVPDLSSTAEGYSKPELSENSAPRFGKENHLVFESDSRQRHELPVRVTSNPPWEADSSPRAELAGSDTS